jgi:hypothetical protein
MKALPQFSFEHILFSIIINIAQAYFVGTGFMGSKN